MEAYGSVDEANSWVGAARSFVDDTLLDRVLEFLQHKFYNCSSNLATPRGCRVEPVGIQETDIQFLEQSIDLFEERSGPIRGFILPGGVSAAGLLHIAADLGFLSRGRCRTERHQVRQPSLRRALCGGPLCQCRVRPRRHSLG